MINNQVKEKIRIKAKTFFKDASGCHDWSHVERVVKLAMKIGKIEKADLDVLEVAALLHDIGRKEEMKSKGSFCHAEKGAEIARLILGDLKIDKEIIDRICHCIISHRNRNNHLPKTIEAKVLFDADKLDSIGAIGVARDFLFAGYAGSKNLYTGNEKILSKQKKNYSYTKEDSAILEYEIILKKIKNKMITKTGTKYAVDRHAYMKNYFIFNWVF